MPKFLYFGWQIISKEISFCIIILDTGLSLYIYIYIYMYVCILDMKQPNVRQCSCQDKILKERPGPSFIMQKRSFIRNKLRTKI